MARHEDNDTTKFYEKYIGMFFTAELHNNMKVKGILRQITPDGKLYIKGKYMEWGIHPSEIKNYFARPDKFKRGDQHNA